MKSIIIMTVAYSWELSQSIYSKLLQKNTRPGVGDEKESDRKFYSPETPDSKEPIR